MSDSFCAMLGYQRDQMIIMNLVQWDVNSSNAQLLGANKLSGFVAHKLSGFHTIPRRYRDETGRMVTGDSENEIRRSIWRMAGRAFDARSSAGVVRGHSGAILTGTKTKAWTD